MLVFSILLSADWYINSHGGFAAIGSEQSFTWLSADNAKRLLNLKQVAGADMLTASPDKPVLVVECARAACEDASLDLAGVAKELKGKLLVVALDPYSDRKFQSGFEKLFVTPQVLSYMSMQMAVGYLKEQKKELTTQSVGALSQDPAFMQHVIEQSKGSPLLRRIYPKFLLFTEKNFELAGSALGLESKEAVLAFVQETFKSISDACRADRTTHQTVGGAGYVANPRHQRDRGGIDSAPLPSLLQQTIRRQCRPSCPRG